MSPEELRERVAAALPPTAIVIALGGGADSAVAAWTCATHPAMRAVFVDHDLAGSPALRSSVEKLADVLDAALTVIPGPVEDGPNLEARARRVRWTVIRENLAEEESVVTGHSRDDLAETVLMNLLRGAGSAGLAAMAAPHPGIIRPLLGFDRAELRRFAGELGLPFTDDPANDRDDLLRNRIRADLMPRLAEEYQPAVRATLARSSRHLAADDIELESAAAEFPLGDDEGAVLLAIALLETVSRPIAARAVRRALRRVNPPYAGTSDDVEAVLKVATDEPKRITLGSALNAAREGPYVAVWASDPPTPGVATLESPGRVRFGAAAITAAPAGRDRLLPRSAVLVDPALFPVTVRAAEPGERIDIDDGSKLIRDVLAEIGVPVRKRPTWPVVVDGARIAAIVAARVAPWARPSGDEAVAVTRERT